ncbi:MAG: hypothetical protein EOP84_25110, partial [Verrucomicrobiaceae bacterium]
MSQLVGNERSAKLAGAFVTMAGDPRKAKVEQRAIFASEGWMTAAKLRGEIGCPLELRAMGCHGAGMPETTESYQFADDGRVPNNPLLPVVVMRGTSAAAQDNPAAWLEKTFKAHGWGATWRWGLYPFHHFHSTN